MNFFTISIRCARLNSVMTRRISGKDLPRGKDANMCDKQNAEKSMVAEKEWGLRSAKPHELHFALPREIHYVRQKAWGAWPENSPRHLPTERDCSLNHQSHQLRIYL